MVWFKKNRKQFTFIYCDCGNELCSTDSFISDIDGIVSYKCSKCGKESRYYFDIAPVPVRVQEVI